jgi:hypothetical protein
MCLLLRLATGLNHWWFMEQPMTSLFYLHPRCQHLWRDLKACCKKLAVSQCRVVLAASAM